MPSPAYYRKQAELFASLALANTSEPYLMERFAMLAEQFLAKADEADIADEMSAPRTRRRNGASGRDRY